MNGPDKERAAVVAYLRELQKHHERWARSNGTSRGMHNYHADACKYAADRIEKGAHWMTEDLKPRYV